MERWDEERKDEYRQDRNHETCHCSPRCGPGRQPEEQPRVEKASIAQPGNQRPCLDRIPTPVATPRLISPDCTGYDGSGPEDEPEADEADGVRLDDVWLGQAIQEGSRSGFELPQQDDCRSDDES